MIIGFAGKAASGKTTAAKFLIAENNHIVILPMAQVLREEVEGFIRQVGAVDKVPLIYGDQDDKVRIFYIDERRALDACTEWSGFIHKNSEIQDRHGSTAVSVRRILQWWGTEYRRAQNHDYWTKAWGEKLQTYDLETVHVLVDDVRFVNELNIIKKHGGIFVRIERPGFNGANNHSSENSLDSFSEWNYVVQNDGSLEQFADQVDNLLGPLLLVKSIR